VAVPLCANIGSLARKSPSINRQTYSISRMTLWPHHDGPVSGSSSRNARTAWLARDRATTAVRCASASRSRCSSCQNAPLECGSLQVERDFQSRLLAFDSLHASRTQPETRIRGGRNFPAADILHAVRDQSHLRIAKIDADTPRVPSLATRNVPHAAISLCCIRLHTLSFSALDKSRCSWPPGPPLARAALIYGGCCIPYRCRTKGPRPICMLFARAKQRLKTFDACQRLGKCRAVSGPRHV